MLDLLSSRVRVKIMNFIALNKDSEFTSSLIARKVKVSKSRASEVLRELKRRKVLKSRRIGRSVLYKFNHENPMALRLIEFITSLNLNNIEYIKRKIIPILKKHGILKAGLFGSVVRGEAGLESDVDILVELPKGKSLFDLVELKLELEEKLKRKVDVVTYRSLHPLLRGRVLEEEVRIYER